MSNSQKIYVAGQSGIFVMSLKVSKKLLLISLNLNSGSRTGISGLK